MVSMRRALVAALTLTGSNVAAQARPTLIVNARVVDGTGAPARAAEVRIVNGRIDAIGHWTRNPNDLVIDAHGLTLAPGFIDTHSHHDRGLTEHRDALAAISQGITTIVAGQDGDSRLPLAAFFARLDSQPPAINVASYVGHGTIRERVMGDDFKRAATDAEVDRMRHLVREEMDAGALGLSTGLEYDPGIFSDPREVLELAKVAGAVGGRYISHIRSEDRDFWKALDEVITIGRTAKMPVQVSHMKLAMRALWGEGDSLVRVLNRARAEGVQVTADVYPYTMWQSTLTVLYPKRNFDDRAETDFILKQVAAPEDLVLGDWDLDTTYVGKDLAQIAALRRSDPATTLMALIAESRAKQAGESVVAKGMDERDIATILRWPWANVSSDGALDGAHPRGFGSFPRVLGGYVREQHVLSLEEAVRKMTTLSAANVGITDRGAIRTGLAADLVLFDPATVNDRATIRDPHALSTGIRTVWVNGEIVFDDGKATGNHPGRVLRREARSASRSECTYMTCALRVEPGFLGPRLVRGANGERRRLGWLGGGVSWLMSGSGAGADSASAYARTYVRNTRISTALGIVAVAAFVVSIVRLDDDDVRGPAATTAIVLSLTTLPLFTGAQRSLSRAVWWYNASLAR